MLPISSSLPHLISIIGGVDQHIKQLFFSKQLHFVDL